MTETHHHNHKANPPYIDRDISWMWFNHRILEEACRNDIPLLERLSFLGIYSNNLDEFYRVRIATLSRLAGMKGKDIKEESNNARHLLDDIIDIDTRYSAEYAAAVHEVTRKLDEAGIRIVDPDKLDEMQTHFVKCVFRKHVAGFISPVWISHLNGFSNDSDDRIYLAVKMEGPGRKPDYAVIQLPSDVCGRFLTLPSSDGKSNVMYLDDIVRCSLPMIFPGMGYTDFKAYSFKFTKDAEMEIEHDLHIGRMEKVAKAVKSRKNGQALRVIYDAEMPPEMFKALTGRLHLSKFDTLKPSGRYHNHKDFATFPKCGRDDLLYEKWTPAVAPELKQTHSLLQLISEKDRYVHVPYQTFDYVVRLLQEAAVSKNVKSIKMTLYRVAHDSKIVEALICAAKNGKKVTAVVELMARFDEASNIGWAQKMQEAGVNVVFGVEGLKVHSKIVLIGMRHGHNIAVVGTGNFHEGNARHYTDYFLMTARPEITRDVEEVFNFIKRPYRPVNYRHLLVSPNEMRERFIELINDEIRNARHGREAWIKLKLNHITDKEMVDKLYEASDAGVRIEILVRGNNSMVAGVAGWSDNIEARGIIDRYLEHSRIFIFHAGGARKTFIGSADWMPRNLDNRVEVVTPVFDPELKDDLLHTVECGLRDNTHSHPADGIGHDETEGKNDNAGVVPFRSQEALYQHYRDAAQGKDNKQDDDDKEGKR